MALLGGYHLATGTAVKLSTLIPSVVKKLDIRANPGNSAVVYIGPASVTAAGVNAWIALSAGDSWGVSEEQLSLEAENAYLIGTASDKVHISYVT